MLSSHVAVMTCLLLSLKFSSLWLILTESGACAVSNLQTSTQLQGQGTDGSDELPWLGKPDPSPSQSCNGWSLL